MRVYQKDLLNILDEKVYEFFYEEIVQENNIFLRGFKNVDGYFIFFYDESDKLKCEYKMIGQMICPDAYTLEDLPVDFELEEVETVTFSENEEGLFIYNGIDEKELIKQIVMPIVPIKVAKNEKIDYPNGADWSVIKEEDMKVSDPRLEVLKTYSCKEE